MGIRSSTPGTAGQGGEQAHHAREPPAAFAGEHEAGQREQQEERLRVHGLQEEGQRADGQVDDRPARQFVVEVLPDESVQQPHASGVAEQRDDDAGDQQVAVEQHPDVAQQHGEQREEGGAAVRVGVAAGGDLDVPDAVPVGPRVEEGAEPAGEDLGAQREAPAHRQAVDADEARGGEGDGEDEDRGCRWRRPRHASSGRLAALRATGDPSPSPSFAPAATEGGSERGVSLAAPAASPASPGRSVAVTGGLLRRR